MNSGWAARGSVHILPVLTAATPRTSAHPAQHHRASPERQAPEHDPYDEIGRLARWQVDIDRKGKPGVSRGRKTTGLPKAESAGLPNVGGCRNVFLGWNSLDRG